MPYRGFVRSSSQGPPHLFKKMFVSRERMVGEYPRVCFKFCSPCCPEETLLDALFCSSNMLTRGTKIGKPKCLIIRISGIVRWTIHFSLSPIWKVPRFIDKTDRECCREVSLLDDSSLDQSARGREGEEPELFKIFPPFHWHFGLFSYVAVVGNNN